MMGQVVQLYTVSSISLSSLDASRWAQTDSSRIELKVGVLPLWYHRDSWQRFNFENPKELIPTSAWRRVSRDSFDTRRGRAPRAYSSWGRIILPLTNGSTTIAKTVSFVVDQGDSIAFLVRTLEESRFVNDSF